MDSDLIGSIQTTTGKHRARSPSPPEESNGQEPSTVSVTASPSQSTLSSIYAGYQRKKSQSVKLTRLDQGQTNDKKVVRFADDFGLQLSHIQMIKSDDLPSGENLNLKDERMKILTYMQADFENPIYSASFSDRLSRSNILLEQASEWTPMRSMTLSNSGYFLDAINNRIYGTIKLISLGLQKRVKVRLTTNHWITFRDYEAVYMINSHDGGRDRFSFTIELDPIWIYHGNQIQFCLCYQNFAGLEYWDNNHQENYRFSCYSRTIPDCTL